MALIPFETKFVKFSAVLSIFSVVFPNLALAAEGGQYAGPIGGTDIGSAYLPNEGVYLVPFSFLGEGFTFAGPDSARSRTTNDVAFLYGNGGGVILGVWPWHPWGTNIASSFEENIVTGCGKIGMRGGFIGENCATNFADPYLDLFAISKYVGLAGARPGPAGSTPFPLPYGLTVAAALSGSIPLAHTSAVKPAVGGKGAWIAAPSISFTYLTGPNLSFWDGTEISTRLYYETSSTSYLTGYKNGDVFVEDFAITQRAGLLQAGLAGTFAAQLTNDQPANHVPAPFNGDRLQDLQLGPVVAYDLPKWNASISAKTLVEIRSENRLQLNSFVLRVAFRIF